MKETTKPRCQCDGCMHCADEYGQVDYKKLNLREMGQDMETARETFGMTNLEIALKAHALRDQVGLADEERDFMNYVETMERYWKLDIYEMYALEEVK